MKKILFNDKYGLTQAVLDGRKTMTRRLVPGKTLACANDYVQQIHGTGHDYLDYLLDNSAYKLGEIVAAAQSYKDISETVYGNDEMWRLGFERDVEEKYELLKEDIAGWTNKMFVRGELMPHQIRIKNVRVERLQDISDEDCMKEGIVRYTCNLYEYRGICSSFIGDKAKPGTYKTPREAFAALIDKVSGNGTWKSNPWVFVYDFELLKLDDHE